jgi:hypothetical protein
MLVRMKIVQVKLLIARVTIGSCEKKVLCTAANPQCGGFDDAANGGEIIAEGQKQGRGEREKREAGR